MDTRSDDLENSVVIVSYLGYMDLASSRVGDNRIVGEAPLDMYLYMRSAVAAFHDTPIEPAGDSPSAIGRILNLEQAKQLLSTVPEERVRHRAGRFMDTVLMLVNESPGDQDMLYLLRLFLEPIRRNTLEAIESGEISRHSRSLKDPNNW